MFTRMTASDIQIICRTLLAFILIIMIGVATAEHQLNTLTHRYDHVQFFNIRRDEGGYAAYVFGMPFKVKAVYQLARLTPATDGVRITVGESQVYVPTRLYIKIDTVCYWLEEWRKQFIAEAIKTKQNFDRYLVEARPYLSAAFTIVKEACHNLSKFIEQLALPK